MTDSLEFAVGHARGEYVTIIGDDDGYLPHALAEMDVLLDSVDTKALRWDSVLYNWPDIARSATRGQTCCCSPCGWKTIITPSTAMKRVR